MHEIIADAPQLRNEASQELFLRDRQPRTTHLLPFTRESAEERERLWDLCRGLATGFVMPVGESV